MTDNKQTPGKPEKECKKESCEGCIVQDADFFICREYLRRMEQKHPELRSVNA